MKFLKEYINESTKTREQFIEELKVALDKIVKEKTLDAWFFNWAEGNSKEKREAEKSLNTVLPGKWTFVEITGNGTNIGCGKFKNKEYNVTVSLSCYSEGEEQEDYIDDYEIE